MDNVISQLLSARKAISQIPNTGTPESTSKISSSNNVAINNHVALQNTQSSQALQSIVQLLRAQGEVSAQVKSVQTLTNTQTTLLQKLNPEVSRTLASTFNTSSSHSAKPSLFLIALAPASNPNALLNRISPTPLKTGDTLELLLNPTKTSLAKNSSLQIVVKPSVESARSAITDHLRQILPEQKNTSQLLNTAHQFQKLPASLQTQLLPKPSIELLQKLSSFSHSEKQLTTPQHIKDVIKNSGLFTENKLQTKQNIHSDLRNVLTQLQNALGHTGSNTQITQQTAQQSARLNTTLVEQVIAQLLHRTTDTTAIVDKPSSANKANPDISFIMQLLGIKPSASHKENSQNIKLLISKQLGQLAQHVQEKIHLNQLRSLTGDASINEQAQTRNPSINIEIPLRWGEQVLPLQVSIKEQEEDSHRQASDDSSDNKESEKVITRRWQVFLSFDLPGNITEHTSERSKSTSIQQLHAQLIIINDTVSATLWSESNVLCQQAKQQLTQLRHTLIANGLVVEELHCIHGKPPSQELSIDYNLIDVVT